jgi:pimeloyl-ACP methyl ester carboxylesterase
MMATFVLVHGAWSGGYTWQRIARNLRHDGHEVYAPTLTGLGERSHLLHPGIDLDTHIADVRNLVEFEQLDRIVLVGHSYGGMVVTGVADAIPEKITTLVYLDAFVPQNGQSAADLQPPGRARPDDGVAVPPLPLTAFGVAPGKAAANEARRRPHPVRCFTQKIKLTGGIDRVKDRRYIYLNEPQPTTFTQFYEKLRAAPGWRTYTIPCTHLVQLDMPDEFSRLLSSFA